MARARPSLLPAAAWLTVWLAVWLAVSPTAATAGEVREDQRLPSPALGAEIAYTIYLPDGHEAEGAAFPVVYLLHGYGGGQREWLLGGLAETLDRLIAAGEIAPVIAVAPEADKSWYVDSARWGGPGDYKTAIVRDLVDGIDAAYPTRAERGARAVAGNSMGGHGALRLAFFHPDRFGQVAALSPAIFKPGGVSWALSPQLLAADTLDEWFPRTAGDTFDAQIFRAQSPFARVAEVAAHPDPPRILLAVGDDDYFDLQDGTVEMYLELRAHGLGPELRVRDGGHDWRLWGPLIDDVFRFLDAGWAGG